MNKGQGSGNDNNADSNDKNFSYISGYLQDGNDITRKILSILDKWEMEGVLIREAEETDKKIEPEQAPAV